MLVRTSVAGVAAVALAIAAPLPTLSVAHAQSASVTCRSDDGAYNECDAGELQQPRLVEQLSRAPCIREKTYGFNPATSRVWVSARCSAVFADVAAQATAGDPTDGAIDRCMTAATVKARSFGNDPRAGRIIDHYPDRDGYHVEGEVGLNDQGGPGTLHFLCTWDGAHATVMLGSGG